MSIKILQLCLVLVLTFKKFVAIFTYDKVAVINKTLVKTKTLVKAVINKTLVKTKKNKK